MEELIEKDCDLCGSQQKHLITTENDYPISCCSDCSLVYVSRVPRVDKGKVIGEYYSGDAEEIEAGRVRYSDVSEFLLDEIARVHPKKGALLDVGCGYGFFLLKARENGWKVFGTELSDVAVEYMREKQGLPDGWFADH
jgi:2-polyprenyl-3-methyl-5-hydroxy-6-metoxy-1,4-benzoquinol methylase